MGTQPTPATVQDVADAANALHQRLSEVEKSLTSRMDVQATRIWRLEAGQSVPVDEEADRGLAIKAKAAVLRDLDAADILSGLSREQMPHIVTDDPWAHRSVRMRCSTCMWYVKKAAEKMPGDALEVGRCRRHAPTMSGYPVVYPTDWCGDHRVDETKVTR